MSKTLSRIIGIVMLIGAVCFLWFALGHPEGAFPWGNRFTYFLFGLYLIVMGVFLLAPFKKKPKNKK
jgi:formate-dependent nitrite reductase membrane component NrfD